MATCNCRIPRSISRVEHCYVPAEPGRDDSGGGWRGGGVGLSLASALRPNALHLAAFVGFILGLSAFVVTESPFIDGNRGAVGVFILACAVAPRPRRVRPGEAVH